MGPVVVYSFMGLLGLPINVLIRVIGAGMKIIGAK